MPEIVIQAVGVAMEEALLVKWLKQPGDAVAVDDAVAEVDTDKATMDVTSPYAGTLGPHLAAEGQIVPVGTVIVEVLNGSEPTLQAPTEPMLQAATEPPQQAATEPESSGTPQPAPATGSEHQPSTEPAPHRLSPRARRLAAEAREAAPGYGTLVVADSSPPPQRDAGRFRELIAAKVAESWREIPHFTVSREVDAGALLARLAALRAEGSEPAPTLTDLLLVALARAVAVVTGIDRSVDLGLAVATEHGVVIPVVRDVRSLTPAQLATERHDAVGRARAGRLDESDLTATPTTTLSNLGAFGVDRFTGIVATGQTSLLTVGRVLPRVVADESGQIRVEQRFDATLNADHRMIDGSEAARLLVAFAQAAETPDDPAKGS